MALGFTQIENKLSLSSDTEKEAIITLPINLKMFTEAMRGL